MSKRTYKTKLRTALKKACGKMTKAHKLAKRMRAPVAQAAPAPVVQAAPKKAPKYVEPFKAARGLGLETDPAFTRPILPGYPVELRDDTVWKLRDVAMGYGVFPFEETPDWKERALSEDPYAGLLKTKTVLPDRTEYRFGGTIHRDDGPAVEFNDGTKMWYWMGSRHRKDGPAIEYANGEKRWFYTQGLND